MPRNVEIKARVNDFFEIERRARSLAGGDGVIIDQVDTFFEATRGRLKLRELSTKRGVAAELIAYERANRSGPRTSEYAIAPVDSPARLRETLSRALGERGVVRKRRTLYMVGQTRVHLDEVDGLGDFLELEVVLDDGQDEAFGREVAGRLMAQLGIVESDLIDRAYIDLLAAEEQAELRR